MIRLYLVSDDPARAAACEFGCVLAALPGWVAVLSEPAAIAALPDGAKAFARWFSRQSLAEFAWQDRRQRGGFQAGLTGADVAALDDWLARRKQAPEPAMRAEGRR